MTDNVRDDEGQTHQEQAQGAEHPREANGFPLQQLMASISGRQHEPPSSAAGTRQPRRGLAWLSALADVATQEQHPCSKGSGDKTSLSVHACKPRFCTHRCHSRQLQHVIGTGHFNIHATRKRIGNRRPAPRSGRSPRPAQGHATAPRAPAPKPQAEKRAPKPIATASDPKTCGHRRQHPKTECAATRTATEKIRQAVAIAPRALKRS